MLLERCWNVASSEDTIVLSAMMDSDYTYKGNRGFLSSLKVCIPGLNSFVQRYKRYVLVTMIILYRTLPKPVIHYTQRQLLWNAEVDGGEERCV